ncbi:hypothetical protein TMU01_16370 [Tenuibacillus multivorans]|uniref:Uncharacterized protein n=1 Tax=Tenuibacillus multivorans TaxID=237069 RepID=A0A1G9Z6I3_9BACI|nr:hypothetical protein TMU01_16370 [Tenuibacillus multivorans]SDN16381.1 hypothetical protein SAMN05216498_1535 [Tenuibacillus multivorans]
MNIVVIVSVLLTILCFYYTLTFIENLQKGDERVTNQSKMAAIICFALAFIIPAFYYLITLG